MLRSIQRALDTVAKDQIDVYVVRKLDDTERQQLATFIWHSEVETDPAITEELKRQRKQDLDEALGALQGAVSDPAQVARGQINAFLALEILTRLLKRSSAGG